MAASGTANKNTFWVNNSGTWVEFNHYEYFRVKKRQNQASEFEIKIYDISTAQKAYFKEQAEVLFFAGETMILKGRIQNIEYASAYEVVASGIGMEVKLLDRELIKDGDNRVQYTNQSARIIVMDTLTRQEQTELYETYAHGNLDSLNGAIGAGIRLGQTFTVGNVGDNEEFPLSFIGVVMIRAGAGWSAGTYSQPGTVHCEVYAVDGDHKPTGDILSSGQINGNALPRYGVDSLTETMIPMSSFLCQPSTEYAFVLYCDTATPADVWGLAFDASSPTYGGGAVVNSGDSGATWTVDATEDVTFRIFGGTLIMTPTGGIFDTDFGNTSMRFEHANRLNALSKTADSFDYNWWASQTSGDDYDEDYINFASNQGETASQKTFAIGSTSTKTVQQKDIMGVVNYVHALGYGDGVNQLNTSMYAASTQSSFLSADIAATNSTIGVSDASVLNTSGTARIAEEQFTYAGVTTNDLTGCVRGANSTTARPHKNLCYLEQQYTSDVPQTGSSIHTYGLMDHTLIDKSVVSLETLEVMASGYLSDRKEPIVRIKITPDEPLTDAALDIGDNVTVTDAEANISGDYRIVGMEYASNYGVLTLDIEVSNRSLEFVEQMSKAKKDAEDMQKYMQGATNLYAITETDDGDASNYVNIRFFLPEEVAAINKVLLNFKLKPIKTFQSVSSSAVDDYRYDLTGSGWEDVGGSVNITTNTAADQVLIAYAADMGNQDPPNVLMQVKVQRDINGGGYADLTNSGTSFAAAWAGGANTYTKTVTMSKTMLDTPGTGSITYKIQAIDYAGTARIGVFNLGTITALVFNNSFTEGTLTSPSVDVYVGEDGGGMTKKGTYTADQTDIDITSLVSAVGTGKWINIQFRPNKEMKIDANAYCQIFLESK